MKSKPSRLKTPSKAASRGGPRWLLSGLCCLLLAGCAWFYLGSFKTAERPAETATPKPATPAAQPATPPVEFKAMIPRVTDYAVKIQASGTLGFAITRVHAETDGRIGEVYPVFRHGEDFSPGQLLLRLDERSHLLALAEANATLGRLEAELDLARASRRGYSSDVAIAVAKLARAEARLGLEESLAHRALRENALRLREYPSGNATRPPTAGDILSLCQEQVEAVQKTLTEARQVLAWADANPGKSRKVYPAVAQDVRDAEAEVQSALDALDATRLDLRRPQLKETQLAVAAARAEHDKALLDLAELPGAREAELKAQLTAARVRWIRLQDDLDHIQVAAPPMAGRVFKTHANPGDSVTRETVLAEVFDPRLATVAVALPRHALGFLPGADREPSPGAGNVLLKGRVAGQLAEWTARISGSENGADTATVHLEIDEPFRGLADTSLLMGLPVTAEMEGTLLHDIFLIPLAAITPRDEAWLADGDGQFRRQPLDILWRDDVHIVTHGQWRGETVLRAGDTIGIPTKSRHAEAD